MAVLTPVDARTPTGALVVKNTAAGGGDTIRMEPGKAYQIIVNNGHSAAQTVTIDDPASGPGVLIASAVSVTEGTSRAFTVKRPLFGKTPTADVALTYSGVTALTVEVYGPLDSK